MLLYIEFDQSDCVMNELYINSVNISFYLISMYHYTYEKLLKTVYTVYR